MAPQLIENKLDKNQEQGEAISKLHKTTTKECQSDEVDSKTPKEKVFPRNCPVYDTKTNQISWEHPHASKLEDVIRINYDEWKSPCGANGWFLSSEKNNLKIFRKHRRNKAVDMIKGCCVIPFPLEKVVIEMMTRKSKLEYEKNLESCKELANYAPGALLEYSLAKTPTRLVAQRDMCMAFGTVQLDKDGGSVMISYASVESPLCPLIKKYVRCDLASAGWIFEAAGESSTRVTTIMDIDVKAKFIPAWLLNLTNESIGRAGYSLKTYMEEKYRS